MTKPRSTTRKIATGSTGSDFLGKPMQSGNSRGAERMAILVKWIASSVLIPLIVSGGIAMYGHRLTVRQSKIDNMVKLFDDMAKLKEDIFKYDVRPGQRAIHFDRDHSPPGLEIPVLAHQNIVDRTRILAFKIRFYYSDESSDQFEAIFHALNRTPATFDFNTSVGARDSNDIIGMVSRFRTVDETNQIALMFDVLLTTMANELFSESGKPQPTDAIR